jgi:iron(III) transport system substrate-binding protein
MLKQFTTTLALCALTATATLPAQAETLILYSAQHPQTVKSLANDFQKLTGINVKIRSGEGPAMTAQLVAEGKATPADVYLASNAPELIQLEEKGLLNAVAPDTLATIPAQYNSGHGQWVGVMARENVLVYNLKLANASNMPASLMDLAQPAWKGKLAIAPSDGDFLPLVSAVLATHGEPATLAWLKGLRSNAQTFDDNEGVVAAVNRGAVAVGIINSYYWARLKTELGDKGIFSALHHFGNGDVGALINVCGAGVLKSAKHADAAQKFLAYLVSERAQSLFASNSITYEYPLRPGVASASLLKPFAELSPPALTVEKLGDNTQPARLLRAAGLL